MKRMIHALMAAAVLVSAMTCTAFAATEGYTKDEDGVVTCTNTETLDYTAQYDKAVAGNQYVLLAVKTDANGQYDLSKAENILYIDQKAAETTSITFDVLPVAENVTDSIVLLGGTFADGQSPKTLGYLQTPAEEEPEPPVVPDVKKGDASLDGRINTGDARLALQYSLKKVTFTDDQFYAADVTNDNRVMANDARRILQYALKKIDSFD